MQESIIAKKEKRTEVKPEANQEKPKRECKRVNPIWLQKQQNGTFIGEKLRIWDRKYLLAFLNVEKPSTDEREKLVINITILDGEDIRGKEMRVPLTLREGDIVTQGEETAEERRQTARKNLAKLISKSIEKNTETPWLSRKIRCKNLEELFNKKLNGELKRALKKWALSEIVARR